MPIVVTLADINARLMDFPDRQLEADRLSVTNGITAFAGGGQANGTQLRDQNNRVTTVVTIADSVKMPPAVFGTLPIVVQNAAANSMNVFPATGDAINALGANAAFAVAGNKVVIFMCLITGTWATITTA